MPFPVQSTPTPATTTTTFTTTSVHPNHPDFTDSNQSSEYIYRNDDRQILETPWNETRKIIRNGNRVVLTQSAVSAVDVSVAPGVVFLRSSDDKEEEKTRRIVGVFASTEQSMTSVYDRKETSSLNHLVLVVSILVLLAVAVTFGFVTCILSHYHQRSGVTLGLVNESTAVNPQDAVHTPTTVPMLSVVSASAAAGVGGMDRLRGGRTARELAAARDRQIRLHAVQTDIALNLPPSIALPDGEEHHQFSSSSRIHIRDPEQESEIHQKCIRPPPNRTVLESESPPPYRSVSATGHLEGGYGSRSGSTSDWSTSTSMSTSSSTASTSSTASLPYSNIPPPIVRCHSMSSSSHSSVPNSISTNTATTTTMLALHQHASIRKQCMHKSASRNPSYQSSNASGHKPMSSSETETASSAAAAAALSAAAFASLPSHTRNIFSFAPSTVSSTSAGGHSSNTDTIATGGVSQKTDFLQRTVNKILTAASGKCKPAPAPTLHQPPLVVPTTTAAVAGTSTPLRRLPEQPPLHNMSSNSSQVSHPQLVSTYHSVSLTSSSSTVNLISSSIPPSSTTAVVPTTTSSTINPKNV